jgi:hypothetical protein
MDLPFGQAKSVGGPHRAVGDGEFGRDLVVQEAVDDQ